MVRLVALLASLALLGGAAAALAHHRPGHGAGPQSGPLSIRVSPTPVTYAGAVTISGRLTGTGNSGQRVTLAEDKFPYGGGYVTVTTATTDAQGDYSFRQVPDSNRNYRVSVAANQTFATVRVRMRITRRVSDSTPSRGEVVRFSGFVSPKHDGKLVLLQRRSSTGAWVTVRRAALRPTTGNQSAYSMTRVINRTGTYRTRVLSDGDHLTSTSVAIRVTVP